MNKRYDPSHTTSAAPMKLAYVGVVKMMMNKNPTSYKMFGIGFYIMYISNHKAVVIAHHGSILYPEEEIPNG